MIKDKKHIYMYSYYVCYIFLIFKFILIYLLHVLFELKNEDIFEKKKPTQKS